jgi:hypothetical protein
MPSPKPTKLPTGFNPLKWLLSRVFNSLNYGQYLASDPTLADGDYCVMRVGVDGKQLSTTTVVIVPITTTNQRSPAYESWKLVRPGAGGVVSSKCANSTGNDLWLLHFDAFQLPADGRLTDREPVKILAGGVNGDAWDDGTQFTVGCIAALSTTQPEFTAVKLQPTVSGAGGKLTYGVGDGFRGLNDSNTDTITGPGSGVANAYAYGTLVLSGGNANLTVFSDSGHVHEIAYGSLAGNGGGVITLTAFGGSGVTGQITTAILSTSYNTVLFTIGAGGFFDAEIL